MKVNLPIPQNYYLAPFVLSEQTRACLRLLWREDQLVELDAKAVEFHNRIANKRIRRQMRAEKK